MTRRAVLIRNRSETGIPRLDMTPDELTRPLGLSPPKPRLAGRVRLAIGLLGVAAVAGVVAFLVLPRSADAPFAVSPIVTRDQASPPGDPSAGSRQSAE